MCGRRAAYGRESTGENESGIEGPQSPRKGAVWITEGRDILGFATAEDLHESASLTGSWSPLHVATPQTSATSTTLTPVAEFDRDEAGDVAGGMGSSLELIKALNGGAEIPHPLGEPWIVGVSEVGRDLRAAQVKGVLNRRVELGYKMIEFLGSHGRRDKNVGR